MSDVRLVVLRPFGRLLLLRPVQGRRAPGESAQHGHGWWRMTLAIDQPLRIAAVGRTAAASPLRYPGGKAALAGFFGDVMTRLKIARGRYVEPYAGGAGA